MNFETKTRSSGEEAILRTIESFMDGWNRHDMAAHTSVFAENADFVDVNGLLMRGRQEIAAEQGKRHLARFMKSTVKALNISTRFIRPDIAVVHYMWEMEGDAGPDGKGMPVRRGIFTFVMSDQGGRWIFDAAHNTNINVS
jgi:uncharacterized protein (TIGR02246 family)